MDPKIKLPVIYSQNDPRWKNTILGTSGTIGNYGCLMCCATMACNLFGHQSTPAEFNELMKANAGYKDGNLFIWTAPNKFYPDVKWIGAVTATPSELTTTQMNSIRNTVDKGYPVFLKIDTIPSTSKLDEHWILCVGYEGDDLFVADPWDGALKRITSWGVKPQKLIWGFTNYTGKVTEAVTQITIDSKLYESLVNKATKWDDTHKYFELTGDPQDSSSQDVQRIVAGYKSRITDISSQLASSQADAQNKSEQVSRLKDELLKSEDLRGALTKSLNEALQKMGGMQTAYEDQLRVAKGQMDAMGRQLGDKNNEIAALKAKLDDAVKNCIKALSASELLSLAFKKMFGKA